MVSDVNRLIHIAKTVLENACEKRKLTCLVYAPKSVVENPEILQNPKDVSNLLGSRWWLKTYDNEYDMFFEEILIFTVVLGNLRRKIYENKNLKSGTYKFEYKKDPIHWTGQEIVDVVNKLKIFNINKV